MNVIHVRGTPRTSCVFIMHCDGFKIQIHIKLRKKQLFYIAFHITIDLVPDQFVFEKKQQSTVLVKEKVNCHPISFKTNNKYVCILWY